MVGSRRLAADAPAAIASFGSGAAQISIRLIFRRGATAYAAALRRDIADRKLAGTSFVLLDSRVARPAAIRQELRSGQVDSRLLLTLGEVARHPHNAARATFIERDGVLQPAPAPRFSRTVPEMGRAPRKAGTDTDAVLGDFGFSAAEIAKLQETGVVGSAPAKG